MFPYFGWLFNCTFFGFVKSVILFSGCENAWLIQYANDVNIRNLNEATCQSPAELAGVRLAETVEMAQKCNIEVVDDDDTQGMWPTHTHNHRLNSLVHLTLLSLGTTLIVFNWKQQVC